MRLADAVLDACRCDVRAPLAGEPARDFGLGKEQARQAMAALRPWLNERQRMLWAQRRDALLPARGAAVDVGLVPGDRLGVGSAALEAALRALRLRQQCVDAGGEFSRGHADRAGGAQPTAFRRRTPIRSRCWAMNSRTCG